jgi:hypothetical protein
MRTADKTNDGGGNRRDGNGVPPRLATNGGPMRAWARLKPAYLCADSKLPGRGAKPGRAPLQFPITMTTS